MRTIHKYAAAAAVAGALAGFGAVPGLAAATVVEVDGDHVTEGDSGTVNANVEFKLDAASVLAVSVDYETDDGSAHDGSDYEDKSGTVTFAPGETEKEVKIRVRGDRLHEGDERFRVKLSNPVNATLDDSRANVTIDDDDPAPTVSIDDAVVTEGAATGTARFRVSLSTESALPASVGYATADATAVAGGDYTPKSAKLTFDPGQTVKDISVEVPADTIHEATETFLLALTDADGAVLGADHARGTILDDDPALAAPVSAAPAAAGAIVGASPPANTAGGATTIAVAPVDAGDTKAHTAFAGLTASHAVRLHLACPAGAAACAGTVRLIAPDSLVVGRAAYQLAPGTDGSLTVKLSRQARRLLARHRKLQLTARGADVAVSHFTLRLARRQ